MSKILLIEDNEMNRDMLSRRLQKKGFEVIVAADGERGLRMAHDDEPDLILMDISLPGKDGYACARALKASQLSHIPIIALTAHAMVGDREKTLEAGCDEYDTKPVELPRLLQKMEKLLNGAIAEPAASAGVSQSE